jgi:hypothetical protein
MADENVYTRVEHGRGATLPGMTVTQKHRIVVCLVTIDERGERHGRAPAELFSFGRSEPPKYTHATTL